jgi:hypothetical protein
MILIAIYFKYLTKEYLPLFYVYFVILVVSCIIALMIPESPKYLIAKAKFIEARISLNYIAKINGMKGLDASYLLEGQ